MHWFWIIHGLHTIGKQLDSLISRVGIDFLLFASSKRFHSVAQITSPYIIWILFSLFQFLIVFFFLFSFYLCLHKPPIKHNYAYLITCVRHQKWVTTTKKKKTEPKTEKMKGQRDNKQWKMKQNVYQFVYINIFQYFLDFSPVWIDCKWISFVCVFAFYLFFLHFLVLENFFIIIIVVRSFYGV